MKLLSEDPLRGCCYRPLILKGVLLAGLLPSMAPASEQGQVENTLPFLIMTEDHSAVMASDYPYIIIAGEGTSFQFPHQTGEGPLLPGARRTPSVEDIPMQAFADLKAKIEEAFEVMGDTPESNYLLESIELHVTASTEGKLLIASAGIEGGMKLVFKRR